MRPKINPRIEFDFRPSNLELTQRYYETYEAMSRVLDETPAIVDRVHQDLKDVWSRSEDGDGGRGSFQYSSDTVLRIIVCQIIEGASLRATIVWIDDSNYLRRFTRINGGPMMDYTTLCRLRNAITPASWKEINRLLVEAAVGRGVIDGERLRLDTTVVETNIHYPTDSSLFWDVYRVLGRLMGRAREFDESLVGPKRVHHRRAKRLYLKISRRGEPIEFGHMIQIQQVGAKVITGYAAFEKKPREHELVEQALEHHRDLFGKYPECLAADRGYYRSIEAIERLKRKVAMVSIAKKGKRTEEEAGREHDPFFRLGQRFRAGIEGTVSFLKRVFRLSRALAKGWEHFAATIGATIFAHNLLILSRL